MTDDLDPIEPVPADPEQLLAADHALADLVDALRAPATPDELAHATTTIASMRAAMSTPNPNHKDRRVKHTFARTAALATAAVLSAAGVAAAATGTNPLEPLGVGGDGPVLETVETTTTTSAPPTTIVVATTSTTTTSTTTTSTTSTTVPAAAAVACETHGERVSTEAKDESDEDERHGAVVSEVARTHTDECDHDEDDDDERATSTSTSTTRVEDHDEDEDDDHETEGAARRGEAAKQGSSGKRESTTDSSTSGKGDED